MKKSAAAFIFVMFLFCVFVPGSYSATFPVSIVDFAFNPPSLTIAVGDTVTWTNNGTSLHSSVSGTNCAADGIWNSGILGPGQSFSLAFTTPGTFPYFCSVDSHCVNFRMKGTVTVNAAAATIPSPVGQQILVYPPPVTPLVSTNPSLAQPVSIGSIAQGGTVLTVQLDIAQFAGPVDIYAAYMVSTNPQAISNVEPDLAFQSFTIQQVLQALAAGQPPAGAVPLMSNVTAAVNTTLFAGILASSLPHGTYTVFLLVTLPSDLSNFYLWETTFTI